MATIQFKPWPKIARLNRDIVVTEKIDGTNAAVLILPLGGTAAADGQPVTVDNIPFDPEGPQPARLFEDDERNSVIRYGDYVLFAQSRTRFITPKYDNFGFAQWVAENATGLVETLGVGRHFGEWWGRGIQRGYGINERRFSLFDTNRWEAEEVFSAGVPGLRVVPVLYRGPFDEDEIILSLSMLRDFGSVAAPRYEDPEGIVIYHTAANTAFKVTLKGDEGPKGGHSIVLNQAPPRNLWGDAAVPDQYIPMSAKRDRFTGAILDAAARVPRLENL